MQGGRLNGNSVLKRFEIKIGNLELMHCERG